jgi:hypothetical protein
MVTIPSASQNLTIYRMTHPVSSGRMEERIGETLSLPDQFVQTFQKLPLPLQQDNALLKRLHNLIDSVDDRGLKGSYAGWITRAALGHAAVRGETAALGSLLLFFQKGGSIQDLEVLTARLLPPFPEPVKDPTWLERLRSETRPMSGWRQDRWKRLIASKDPLKRLKLAELGDIRLRLTAGDSHRGLRSPQLSAYLRDDDARALATRIGKQASRWTEESDVLRHVHVQQKLSAFLPTLKEPMGSLWPLQVKGALECLGDEYSRATARRIQSEYRLFIASGPEFELE